MTNQHSLITQAAIRLAETQRINGRIYVTEEWSYMLHYVQKIMVDRRYIKPHIWRAGGMWFVSVKFPGPTNEPPRVLFDHGYDIKIILSRLTMRIRFYKDGAYFKDWCDIHDIDMDRYLRAFAHASDNAWLGARFVRWFKGLTK